MRKVVYACLVLLGGVSVAHAQTLKDARQRLLRGNYAEAKELYAELAKKPEHRRAATIGRSKPHQAEGEYDSALTAVDAALKQLPKDADLIARRAELLYLRGRWDDADKAAAQAVALNTDHFLARWILGQVLRDRGEITKADEEFRWFVRTYTNRSNMDKDITDPDELLLVGLAGCER